MENLNAETSESELNQFWNHETRLKEQPKHKPSSPFPNSLIQSYIPRVFTEWINKYTVLMQCITNVFQFHSPTIDMDIKPNL